MTLTPKTLNPEFSLVLKLSKYYDNENNFPVAEVENLLEQCDFDRFQKKLNQARSWPVVYQNIKSNQIRLPDDTFQALKNKVQKNIFQCLQNHRLLKQLQQAFQQKKILCFSLKGTLLAEKLLGDIGLRHSNDIDLLVYREQLSEAREVLENMGYICSDKEVYGSKDDQHLQKLSYHSLYHHNQSHTILELHWRPTATPDIMVLPWSIWNNIELSRKASCQLLPDNELFIYLCLHGSLHLWSRIKWLADIEQMMLQKQWDWQQLLDKAYEYHCERCLALGVLLAHQLYQSPLPPVIEHYLEKQPSIYSLAKKTIDFSFNKDNFINDNLTAEKWISYNAFWYKMQLCSTYSCKLHRLSKLIQPNIMDLKLIHLPDSLFFIYYFIRPVRITFDILIKGINNLLQLKNVPTSEQK